MAKKSQYEVGYGKPPIHSRFAKGKSGNPHGRPHGSQNKRSPEGFSNTFLEEGRRLIEVRENGTVKMMPNDRALIRKVIGLAGAGDMKAMKIVLDELRAQETRLSDKKSALFAAAVDFKRRHAEETKQRRMRGEPEIKYMYHPDDFHLNFETESVTYVGLTPTAEEYYRALVKMKQFYESSLILIVEDNTIEEGEDMSIVFEDIRFIVSMLEKINAALGIPWARNVHICPDLNEMKALKEKFLQERQK